MQFHDYRTVYKLVKLMGIFTECNLQSANKIFLPEVEIDSNKIFINNKINHQNSIHKNNHYFQNDASKKKTTGYNIFKP